MSSKSPSADASRETPAPRTARDAGAEGVAVGRILKAHGIRGEVKVEVWSDVEGRFAVDTELKIRPHTASGLRPHQLRIVGVRPDRGALLIRFAGIESRDAAEPLRSAVLEIDEAQVPEAPEGFYYHYQLVGCGLRDQNAGELGTVAEVLEDGGGHILRVESEDTTVLVPFVDAFLRRVDIEGRSIEVDLPAGLIESCTSRR